MCIEALKHINTYLKTKTNRLQHQHQKLLKQLQHRKLLILRQRLKTQKQLQHRNILILLQNQLLLLNQNNVSTTSSSMNLVR